MNWFLDPITKHYADFTGRASRQELWMFMLGTILVYAFLVVAAINAQSITVFLVALILTALALFIPTLALQVRRLHDIGFSGWWILLSFVPYLGLVTLIFFCLPSQEGTNKYGPHPYGIEPEPEFEPTDNNPQVGTTNGTSTTQ
jgi:uncharacterized membrane protein YhaH (DUF805 family)